MNHSYLPETRHSIHRRICSLTLLATLLLAGTAGRAQTTSASLSGSITDPSGAAIPGAQVTVQSVDTSQTQTATTTDEGTYTFPNLPPGNYTVTIKRDGFNTDVEKGLVLTVGQAATLKATMTVGTASETVSVTAAGTVINQSTAEISTLVNERSVKELPLNGRDPSSLVLLAPGTTNILNTSGSASNAGVLQTTNSFPSETGASANGGRQGSTYYLLDGVQNMDTYLLLAAPFPNADATQEFRVITNNFDARYGFAPGAVVTIQTRSGSNEFHGGVFEFLRNNDLNAGNYFTHAVDPLKRNQFGGYAGGPIKKDRLFFFGNYQETKASTSTGTNVTYTPTAAMLAGDFSAVPQDLTPDVATGQRLLSPFRNVGGKTNQVDRTLFNPAAVALAGLVPLGQTPATGQVNYAGALQKYTYKEATGRLDWDLSKTQRLTVRNFLDYIDQPEESLNGNILSNTLGQTGRLYNEVVTHTWTVSPTSVNVVSGAFLQNDFYSAAAVTNASGAPVCLSQYIAISDPANTCYIEGGIQITNGFGQPYTAPNQEDRRTWTINDDFSKVLAQHTLTVGGNALHQYANEVSAYPANPTVFFNGQYTSFGLADYLLGDASGFRQGGGETQNQTGIVLGIYAQDSWRIKPNFTLTAGVRWEPNLPPSVKNGRGAAFIPGEQSTRYPNAPVGLVFPGDPGVDASLLPRDYMQWGPRIGMAWQPKELPNTSVRGAFGMFYSPLEYSAYNHTADLAPFSPTYSFSGTTTEPIPFSNPYTNANSGTNGVNPFPPFASAGQDPPSTATFPTNTTPPGLVSVEAVFSRNFKLGTTVSYNFSIEQQFGNDFALHLAYVGNQSYHQVLPIDLNPGIYADGGARTSYTQFAHILENDSVGTAKYNSLQVGVEKRLSHNLQFQSNFTWAKTEDTFSGNSISFGGTLPNPFNLRYNFGKSDLNIPLISVTNFVYDTPSLAGHNFLLRNTLGGWEVTGIYTMQSGLPFGISGGNGGNNSLSQQDGDRADYAPGVVPNGTSFGVHRGSRQQWLTNYFDTTKFVQNAAGTFGNSQRNIFQGPGINTGDIGLMKNWAYRERYRLQFRWEMFNAFNRPSFATPNADPSSGNFGQITAIGAVPPRLMQAALKLTF